MSMSPDPEKPSAATLTTDEKRLSRNPSQRLSRRLTMNPALRNTLIFNDPVEAGPKTPAIQNRPRPIPSRWYAVSAIALGLAIIAFLCVVAAVPIYVGPKHGGEPSARARTGYTLGTNILNVIVSVYIASRLKSIWLDSIESKLGQLGEEQAPADDASVSSSTVSRMKKTLIRDTLLGLSSAWERLYCWNVIICLAVVGLIATSINSALTLTSVYDYKENVGMTLVAPQMDNKCTFLADSPEATTFNPASVTFPLPNGSYVGVYTNDRQGIRFDKVAADKQSPYSVFSICPVMNAITLLGSGIYPATSQIWPYMVLSAGVYPDALGFPADVYDGVDPVFWSRHIPDLQKVNFQAAVQCVPIMKRNPVQCKASGTLTVDAANKNMTIMGDNNCTITSSFYGVDLKNPKNGVTGGATVSGICTGDNVGEATIVMGSIGKHAENLAEMMEDKPSSNDTYTVTCTMSVADTLDFRRVNYSRVAQPGDTEVNVQYAIKAISLDTCTPPGGFSKSDILTPSLIATAAMGPIQLVSENPLNDGWFEALSKAYYHSYHSDVNGKPHMSFDNSRNNLEDIFGVTASMMMANYMGTDDLATPHNKIELPDTAVYMRRTRIGAGKWYSYLFIIPTVFAIGLLAYFFAREHRKGGIYAPTN